MGIANIAGISVNQTGVVPGVLPRFGRPEKKQQYDLLVGFVLLVGTRPYRVYCGWPRRAHWVHVGQPGVQSTPGYMFNRVRCFKMCVGSSTIWPLKRMSVFYNFH
jgi:hypothetical protein